MKVLKVEDVWKIYSNGVETYALRGVSLAIERGEFVAIMGPSGSGKSTLLHIMGLLDTPTRGRVILEGRDVSHLSEEERALVRRRRLGFVFQAYNLIPHLTVLENVQLPLILEGVEEDERKERAEEMLKRVGLRNRMNYYPNQLSGGQKQRVAIARALINNPAIILADEPTGNLDSKTGESILKLFEELHSEGRTLVIVTHDMDIANHAERIVKIRDGVIIDE